MGHCPHSRVGSLSSPTGVHGILAPFSTPLPHPPPPPVPLSTTVYSLSLPTMDGTEWGLVSIIRRGRAPSTLPPAVMLLNIWAIPCPFKPVGAVVNPRFVGVTLDLVYGPAGPELIAARAGGPIIPLFGAGLPLHSPLWRGRRFLVFSPLGCHLFPQQRGRSERSGLCERLWNSPITIMRLNICHYPSGCSLALGPPLTFGPGTSGTCLNPSAGCRGRTSRNQVLTNKKRSSPHGAATTI